MIPLLLQRTMTASIMERPLRMRNADTRNACARTGFAAASIVKTS
jgi:hypothetical protein